MADSIQTWGDFVAAIGSLKLQPINMDHWARTHYVPAVEPRRGTPGPLTRFARRTNRLRATG